MTADNPRRYFGAWDNLDGIKADFEEAGLSGFPVDAAIVFACYGISGYEGTALVVYEHDGQLFEVNGSHCSCYGLEGQWSLEPTSRAALAMREVDRYFLEEDHDAQAAYRRLFPKEGA
jgi:hypothetical protein